MSKLKATVLSLSVVTVMAGAAVGPALRVIADYFSDVKSPHDQIGYHPPFAVYNYNFTVFRRSGQPLILQNHCDAWVDFIRNRRQRRRVCEQHLCAAGFSRGVGHRRGALMPLSTGLIAYYFEKGEQSKLMGYSVAMNNLGGIIATLLSGYLVSVKWRYTFVIYLLGILVMVLVFCFLPKAELKQTEKQLDRSTIRIITPYVLAMFV